MKHLVLLFIAWYHLYTVHCVRINYEDELDPKTLYEAVSSIEDNLASDEEMTLRLAHIDGIRTTYKVKPSTTLYVLKTMIKEKEGFPVSGQRLIFKGKEIFGDNRQLQLYNFTNYDTIFLRVIERKKT